MKPDFNYVQALDSINDLVNATAASQETNALLTQHLQEPEAIQRFLDGCLLLDLATAIEKGRHSAKALRVGRLSHIDPTMLRLTDALLHVITTQIDSYLTTALMRNILNNRNYCINAMSEAMNLMHTVADQRNAEKAQLQ